jgi:hypothetical protein
MRFEARHSLEQTVFDRAESARFVEQMVGLVIVGVPLNKNKTKLELLGSDPEDSVILHSVTSKTNGIERNWKYFEAGKHNEELHVRSITDQGEIIEAKFFPDNSLLYKSSHITAVVNPRLPQHKDIAVLHAAADLLTPYLDIHVGYLSETPNDPNVADFRTRFGQRVLDLINYFHA